MVRRAALPPQDGAREAGARDAAPGESAMRKAATRQPSFMLVLGLYALAFLLPAWPWLSGTVTVPWDAKAQFFPAFRFLADALAAGDSPLWTPHVFAGWPQICDPQSLLFSPLHVLLAWFHPQASLRAFDAVTFAQLFFGGVGIILFFHDRGWHAAGALVAALAFAFGGSASARLQHVGQIISLAYLPLALFLLARALDRASWKSGAGAGLLAGLMAAGRDQVALLSLYVLAGFVLAHWLTGPGITERLRASIKPLVVSGVMATTIAAVPVMMTALLAARSNRPEIDYLFAGRGSLHPSDLLTLVFADLFGAMNPEIEFWNAASVAWAAAFGPTQLFNSQNMGLLYSGAVPVVALLSFGVVRGLAWSREVRFFTIAALLTLLYALGWYTPVFRAVHAIVPGVAFFRRPADATFVLGALIAIVSGYLVHRWLEGSVPTPNRVQRMIEFALPVGLMGAALALAHAVVTFNAARVPIVTGLIGAGAATGVLALARRLAARAARAATALLAAFTAADLAWNNAPHISTALPPAQFEALRPETPNETVRLIKARLAAAAAPDRRDRVELIGVAYHWPNLPLAQGFDHVFGHNPLRLRSFFRATGVGDTVAVAEQRVFSALYPSYRSAFADLLGVRIIATGIPVEQIDPSLRPGDLSLIARTPEAFVYENPRALPRVMVVTQWRLVNFDALFTAGWPPVDPRQTVLLEQAPVHLAADVARRAGQARMLRYANTQIDIEVEAPDGALLVLNDVWDPWWRAVVDGENVEILRANVIFRAVEVPPGRHRVRFSFHPLEGAWKEIARRIGLTH